MPPRNGRQYLESVQRAVESEIETSETLWYVASGVTARQIVDGPTVLAITNRRMLFFTQPPRVVLLKALHRQDFAVQHPTSDGIVVRLRSGKAGRLSAFEPATSERLGAMIHRFVLGPTGAAGGDPECDISGLDACEYLGGHGLHIGQGELCAIAFQDQSILVRGSDGATRTSIPMDSVREIDFSGPGKYQTGIEFSSYAPGAAGALLGALRARALNNLTSKTKVSTIVRIATQSSAGHWEHTKKTPEQLRIELSWVLSRVTENLNSRAAPQNVSTPPDLVERLARLAELHRAGDLSESEFEAAKARLLGSG